MPLDRDTVERLAVTDPAWLVDRRRVAYERFEGAALPSPKAEIWRYVDLSALDLASFEVARPGEPLPPDGFAAAGAPGAVATVVDGRAIGVDGAVEGVLVEGLAAAAADREELLRSALDLAGISPDLDVFTAAHEAFGGDGALVHVAKGAMAEAPVLVEVQTTVPGSAAFPRVVVTAEEAAAASVVVRFRSPDAMPALVVPQLVVLLGPGAVVDLVVVQDQGDAVWAPGHARVVTGRDAGARFAEAGIGGRYARWQLGVELTGDGAEANVVGAYFGDGTQTLDYRYLVRHAALRTRSEMFLKGAVEDEALSVFTGLIRIEEGAQRTDAFQTNRNLILSEGAAAQSVPNLEILANDVRCGHGSTVGPLDREQRYYLMSRGLTRDRAERLQVRGFFEEAISRFPVPGVRDFVRERINGKFIAAQEEGRL